MPTSDEILEHAGVKGMKWGVRKNRKNKPNKPGQRNYDPKKLNNQELKKVVARMRLEQEYMQLNTNQAKKGQNAATKLLKNAGNKRLEKIAEASLGLAVGYAISQLPKIAKSPKTRMAAQLAVKVATPRK